MLHPNNSNSPSPPDAKPASPDSLKADSLKAGRYHQSSQAALRETIESVVVAFILAFLFRTFEAEAFVIPTGSMAPTALGRHKDYVCPQCGCPYQVSASEEVDLQEVSKGPDFRIVQGTCPMCRYTADLRPENLQHKSYPSYNGDRVLVSKFAYEFADPKRWDIVVFKCPGDASVNYVKRLIGLPGETIHIEHGNIWVRRGEEPFHIARKPAEKLLAMLQPVFDNDYAAPIDKQGWQPRWTPESSQNAQQTDAAGVWRSEDSVSFVTDGTMGRENWIRYHHQIPTYDQWMDKAHAPSQKSKSMADRPQLITDFTAYDTRQKKRDITGDPAPPEGRLGIHWVGDLALECTADSQSDSGEVIFELRKGGRLFQCRVDVSTGQATLSISGDDMQSFHPSAMTSLRGKGEHHIRFSNSDDELRLWVDDRIVTFNASTAYDDLGNSQPDNSDREPVGIASIGLPLRISHLRILRDLYYIAAQANGGEPLCDYEDPLYLSQNISDQLIKKHLQQRAVEFPLQADQFFMLGDNSADSYDGRLWGSTYWVDRDLLVGKALCIYWPHSWHMMHTPWGTVPFPCFPNYQRMSLLR